jgi:hypothetical protein
METTDQPMKIAFCGASGTGKTTLARYISEKYDLPMNPVGSRSTASLMGFKSPYDVDKANRAVYRSELLEGRSPEAAAMAAMADYDTYGAKANCRSEFQTQLQVSKIDWEENHDSFVVDRTTMDDYCYAAMHSPESIDMEFIERAREHVKKYDIVFFTPFKSFINTDGDQARVESLGYHKSFEIFLTGCSIDFAVLVTFIWSRDLEKRKRQIDSVIAELHRKRKNEVK